MTSVKTMKNAGVPTESYDVWDIRLEVVASLTFFDCVTMNNHNNIVEYTCNRGNSRRWTYLWCSSGISGLWCYILCVQKYTRSRFIYFFFWGVYFYFYFFLLLVFLICAAFYWYDEMRYVTVVIFETLRIICLCILFNGKSCTTQWNYWYGEKLPSTVSFLI